MTEQIQRGARADYWQKQIEAWRASGQSQMAYCEANDLRYSRFVYWRRKFQPADETARGGRRSAFVPGTYLNGKTGEGLAVVLPSGVELRGVTAENLVVVDQLLSRWS